MGTKGTISLLSLPLLKFAGDGNAAIGDSFLAKKKVANITATSSPF